MVWIKAKKVITVFMFALLSASFASAQESLWKTFNQFPDREVPSYGGGLSPFPQRQEQVDEVVFEQTPAPISDIDEIEADESLSQEEKNLMLTTSILAEIKAFLTEESVFVPNLEKVIIEATAKANGKPKALIKGQWRGIGDTLKVSVDEARDALSLLDRLRDVDEQIAETVEAAVMERTSGKGEEIITVKKIAADKVLFEGSDGQEYIVNFIKSPF